MATAAAMREGSLLERDGELAALEALIEQARTGRGGIALIEGEAGIGKSELLRAAGDQARQVGACVLCARGSEVERDAVFGVASQLLHNTPAAGALDAADVEPPEGADFLTGFEAVRAAYAAFLELLPVDESAPALVLTVDDAHWADEASLRLLVHVALRLEEQPIAVLATVRTEEHNPASQRLLQALRESPAAGVLTPAALSQGAVSEIVARALPDAAGPALAAACAHVTGGNPFYLHELLNALANEPGAPVPERVREVAPPSVLRSIVVRLGRLGAAAGTLARAAAILGDGAPLRLAAELAQEPEDVMESSADTLAAAGIFARGEPLRFRHPLIPTLLESDMGEFARARLHRRAAQLLLAHGAPADRIGPHLLIARPAGDPETVAVLREAASRSLASGAPLAAARLLERALAEPPLDARTEAELLMACARAETLAGSPSAAGRLERLLELIHDDLERADVLGELATLAHHQWDLPRVVELAARARGGLGAEHPRHEKLLGIELAATGVQPGLDPAADRRLESVLAQARAGNAPSEPRLCAVTAGWLAISDPPAVVRRLAERAIDADPLIDASHGISLGWIAVALDWTDELELAERWLERAVKAAERDGAAGAGAVATLQRANVHYRRGRLEEALADGRRALDIYRFGWFEASWSVPVLLRAHVARGELDAALTLAARLDGRGLKPQGLVDGALLLEARARMALATGDPEAALHHAQEAGTIGEGQHARHQPRVWEWRRLAALAAHRLGEQALARELLRPDLAVLRKIGPARQLGAALTVAGELEGGEAGLQLLAEAAALTAASPARMQQLETLLALGGALRRAGRRTAAKEPLYRALELAGASGAQLFERQAHDELARLGLRPRRSARNGVDALTASEQRVAELAAEGLSNPQIAQRLHVSVNTVETHLRHVYRKLGISRRGELRAALPAASRPSA
jgi:DNA-binding CsgD family transcriptional regulator